MSKKAMMHGNSEREGKRVGAGKFAGMPTEVQMKAYPKGHEYGPTDLDDTMTEIDGCNRHAHTTARKHMSNQH
jgi:hypothetical protein